ncbi:MAG: hypothetical protein BWY79_02080 [Actinobacteria bacterium ADurb.Bin444]|nr:MAG: hypothetical protein BWY79_02080 [Actinobacteria bacterium ADurb.Bin444]
MAHWLFWHRNTTGARNTAAKFMASWKSPSEVAPSPKMVKTTARSLLCFMAQPIPTACNMCVPTGTETGSIRESGGNSWPRSSPPQYCSNFSGGMPRSKKEPVSRKAGTSQSSLANAYVAPIWAASCPSTRANVPIRPCLCSLSMRSSSLRVVTIVAYSSWICSGVRLGMSAASTTPAGSKTSTRGMVNDTRLVMGTCLTS